MLLAAFVLLLAGAERAAATHALVVTPISDSNPVGTTHTLTATVSPVSHAHAAPAEGRERLLQEGGAGRASLVGQGRDVGVAAVVVDGDVQVLHPERAPRVRSGARLGEAMACATLGDAPELLHVEVQQVARGWVLVADLLPGEGGREAVAQRTA